MLFARDDLEGLRFHEPACRVHHLGSVMCGAVFAIEGVRFAEAGDRGVRDERVLAAMEGEEGFVAAELDFGKLRKIRKNMPSLEHRRLF